MDLGMERAIEDKHPKRHDPGSPNAATYSLEKLPFRLQHGEKIIRELKPQFFGFMMTKAFGSYIMIVGLVIVLIAGLFVIRASLAGFLVELLLLPLFVALLVLIISLKPLVQYGKSWYWITNHRVIGKKGFLGYSINSVPLENVADVVLTRTLLDRILGLSSLIVVSMGNAAVQGGSEDEKSESPNFFPALDSGDCEGATEGALQPEGRPEGSQGRSRSRCSTQSRAGASGSTAHWAWCYAG